ncbi:MAG: sugar porter family MFS transporter [Verrucomicrobiaceae bacterium]|nr:sugar porter family MFS transporter [Verrucomicrobiaceae bacterium]
MQKNTIKKFMFWIAFVASLGGFLFGFDTVVISGAEKSIKEVYQLSGFMHGFTMASAIIGTLIGALFCGKPAERFGRLECLKFIAYMYFISAIGCAVIVNWYAFVFFRFLGGLAVGASSVVGPMYIAEISPSAWRGRFVAFFQFNIVLGLVSAYISNYFLYGIENDWLWMLGVEGIPALLFAILLFTVPESPRWLALKNRDSDAKKVLTIVGGEDIEKDLNDIKLSLANTQFGEALFQFKYWKPIAIAFLIATLNQLSGINAINYYAPRIIASSGVLQESAMLQSIPLGVTNLIFTMLGMFLIDKLGRRVLLFVGSIFMTIFLFAVALGFEYPQLPSIWGAEYKLTQLCGGLYMMICLMGFLASFAMSLGATIWVVISEVFPTSVRAKGQVLGSMTHWFWCAAITWAFPIFAEDYSGLLFGFFGIMSVLTFFFAMKIPETKDKSLEQIQRELT